MDPSATDQQATTLPVQLPISSSLQSISAAKACRRGARGVASGRKGPKDNSGRSAIKRGGGGRWIKAAAPRVRYRDEGTVSSDGEGGEYCAREDGQEGSNNKSIEWIGADSEESEELVMQEDGTTAGGAE